MFASSDERPCSSPRSGGRVHEAEGLGTSPAVLEPDVPLAQALALGTLHTQLLRHVSPPAIRELAGWPPLGLCHLRFDLRSSIVHGRTAPSDPVTASD